MKYPMRSAFLRLHAMMPRKRSILSEEASGAIKMLKRLERTVRIDRMDDYLAIYHKTSDAPSLYPLSMSKAYVEVDFEGGRNSEEFGAIKTLKRLDHTNPSVGIDRMNDYQATVTYNKRWQNQSFLSVNVFTFVGSRPPTAFMACCSSAKS